MTTAASLLPNPIVTSATNVIDLAIAREKARRTFRRDQIRVSSIATCARKVVGEALGIFTSGEFPWIYGEGGHLLEAAAGRRLREIWPDSQEQVSVPTSAAGTWTHPDVLLVFAMTHGLGSSSGRVTSRVQVGHGVQIKSTKRRGIWEYQGLSMPGKFGVGVPKDSQVDQALLEWHFWKDAGFCLTQDGGKVVGVPETYELLYIGREDFGGTRCSIEVKWDEARAAALAAEFARRVDALKWHELPERPYSEPKILDCYYEPKIYDWDGKHYMPVEVCPLYEKCWGRQYVPSPAFQTGKKVRASQ